MATANRQVDDRYTTGQDIPEELRNSADKILHYSGISKEKADLFKIYMGKFMDMRDKSFGDESSRKLREAICAVFFEVYTAVLKRVLAEKKSDRLQQMFLNYGYMDERLLTAEQSRALYELSAAGEKHGNCQVYSMQAWLEKIYTGDEEPSVNEFGQDYQDLFREKKKRGQLTDKDKRAYDADLEGRLQHELDSTLKLGQRLCFGQAGGYFPILHQEMISRDIASTLLSPARIEASFKKILQVDFSAFHREVVYFEANNKLGAQLIMKQVWPAIILSPIFGHRGVMWQTTSGKVKSTPARFVLPVFSDENLDDLMTELVAKFRWELSREMAGFSVNKGNEVSLYGDYCDYIQFYQKNRDLSGEAKEKIKTQLKRNRNNVEQLFALDYHSWINYEANGLFRINKVARDLFFKHCPFPNAIRASLEDAPLYNAIISRFEMIREKQIKTLNARYTKLGASGTIHPDLLENLRYYQS